MDKAEVRSARLVTRGAWEPPWQGRLLSGAETVRAALPNWHHRGEAGGVLGGGRVMAHGKLAVVT